MSMETAVESRRDWSTATEEELEEGYRQMAGDEEREREAMEWCEGLIGDGFVKR